jgi:hypothetical protein
MLIQFLLSLISRICRPKATRETRVREAAPEIRPATTEDSYPSEAELEAYLANALAELQYILAAWKDGTLPQDYFGKPRKPRAPRACRASIRAPRKPAPTWPAPQPARTPQTTPTQRLRPRQRDPTNAKNRVSEPRPRTPISLRNQNNKSFLGPFFSKKGRLPSLP